MKRTKKIKLKRMFVPIDKLVTMAELGLGAKRPLNKEKRGWINKLKKQSEPLDPILVTPIKDSGYFLLTDGWHRVQAAKAMKEKEIKQHNDPKILPIHFFMRIRMSITQTATIAAKTKL